MQLLLGIIRPDHLDIIVHWIAVNSVTSYAQLTRMSNDPLCVRRCGVQRARCAAMTIEAEVVLCTSISKEIVPTIELNRILIQPPADARIIVPCINYKRIKEKIQLGAGLDGDMNLSQVAINRGLNCLERFKQYIDENHITQLIAVGTNTLRNANNSHDFILAAEKILNTPVQIISGEEEAELIFSAVIEEIEHSTPGLVIDIGGGSTEFATGDKQQISFTGSLEMGCLSYYKRFFADGKIYSENVRAAEKAAKLELRQQ